jgi:predicted NAD/FAD-binding protein
MRIAVVGTGIAGLTAAHLLHPDSDLAIFEANDYAGGHTRTVETDGHRIDTGFIVHNDRTYPEFVRLLDRLGVGTKPSDMSFSVRCERSGLEYNGTSLNALFAQRRNLFRPSFLRMVVDILRFHRAAPELLRGEEDSLTLGAYLGAGGYSRGFVDRYVVPMGSAIWSTDPGRLLDFPARTFVEFFRNHGMLSVNDRPQWRVVKGGSSTYVDALTRPFRDRIRLRTPVERVRRHEGFVEVTPAGGASERFDEAILACHADEALRMLADPSAEERAILGALPFQENRATLHTDAALLPRRRLAWAAWNYHVLRGEAPRVAVTYHMNRLQGLVGEKEYCVTLNREAEIPREKVVRSLVYHHPLYTTAGMAARRRWAEISGVRRTHYCGAYWGFGFHEDGVKSALRVCARFGKAP